MIIKVCGMRERENIKQLVDKANPDLMGMIFHPSSPRVVTYEKSDLDFFKKLEIPKVGVFVDSELEYIQKTINDYGLNYVQLHGHESVELVKKIKTNSSIGVIKVIRVAEDVEWKEFEPYEQWVDFFLFDTSTIDFGGSGTKFNWAILESYPFQKQFLLSGGVDEESIETISALAIKIPQLAGVDINSRFELSPGVKDMKKVHNFVKEIRNKIV